MTMASSVYVDTSALLKRWLEVAENSAAIRLFDDPHRRFITSDLTIVEITSAVSRRIRMAELSIETGSSLLNQVFRDLETFVAAEKLQLYPINQEVVAESVQCLRRCAAIGLALRSLDAIHIATALTVEQREQIPFITADKQQSRAAHLLGLADHLV